MSDVRIAADIHLDRTEFAPGETIEGRIDVRCPEPWKADYLDVVLAWKTEGVGDEDKGLGAEKAFVQKDEQVRPLMRGAFRFTAPLMPWSHYGGLIKINWTIGLYAKEDGEKEFAVEVPVSIHPLYAGGGGHAGAEPPSPVFGEPEFEPGIPDIGPPPE